MTALLDFDDWELQTVTWAPITSRDSYGAASYGTPSALKAYIVDLAEERRVGSAEERAVHTAIYILDAPDVKPEDKITLPDGSTPTISAVKRYYDEHGNAYYTQVLLGAMETRF